MRSVKPNVKYYKSRIIFINVTISDLELDKVRRNLLFRLTHPLWISKESIRVQANSHHI
jgi:hypothetical protein